MKKYILSVITIFIILFWSQSVIFANNDNNWFLKYFPNNQKIIIWCYNKISRKIRKSDKCYYKWDSNIILPTKSQIKIWLKYFNKNEIINRLALVNFESWFNPFAWNNYAYWYVQTLRKYHINPDIDSQLQWLKKRQNEQKVKYTSRGSKRCWIYWNQYNYIDWFNSGEYWVLSCLYRYHYNSKKWVWYSNRGIKITKFYKKTIFSEKAQY